MAKTVQVPSGLKQSGIVKDATNNYNTRTWASGTGQAAVCSLWKKSGRTQHKSIATINGNYLVAVAPVFGKAGDGIVIHLEGGTDIPAIIADVKGSDKQNKYGHTFGNGISLVEWEAYTVYQNINLGSWAGKKVKSITNLGTYKSIKGLLSADGGESGVSIYLKEAASHIGPKGKEWTKKTAFAFQENAWCAYFQCAVATVTKFAGKIMSNKEGMAGNFGKAIVEDYGGTYIKGPGLGAGKVVPQPGDFIESTGTSGSRGGKYSSGHVGVVEKVKGGTITSIDGSYSGTVARRTFSTTSKNVLWYARPDWDKVGGSEYSDGGSTSGGGGLLYDTLSTRADATIRDVCYADDEGLATKKKDVYRLNVLNYTSALFWIVYALGGTGEGEEGEGEFSGDAEYPGWMNSNMKYVFQFLMEKGLNKAAVCGIMGNMRKENTNFKPGLFNGSDHHGICQWSSSRYKNTDHTIEAECNLLWKELNGDYKSVLSALKKVKDNTAGCNSAAETFCRKFEVCGNYGTEVPERQKYALKFFKGIKVSEGTGEGDGKTVGNWMVPVKRSYYVNNYGEYGAHRDYETHPGIDMAAPVGTPIYAANGGTVILAQMWGGYGNCVRIKHSGGLVSLYGHGSRILVKSGQKVSKGQEILKMGSTGFSTGSHLHFQINKGTGTGYNTSVNPRKYCKIHGVNS